MNPKMPLVMTIPNPHKSAKVRVSSIGRKRSKPHYSRKLYHLMNGLLCFAAYAFVLTREQALMMLVGLGGLFVLLDVLRVNYPKANRFGTRVFGGLLRREEMKSLSGNSFFIFGLFLITFLFPKPIVLLSVLFLAVGDPIAAIVGTNWGKHRLPSGKSLEGAAANFAACTAATLLVGLTYFGMALPTAGLLALCSGVIATAAELVPLKIDDNFTIPVLSAFGLTLANLLFSFF